MENLTNHDYGIIGVCVLGLFALITTLVTVGFRYLTNVSKSHREERREWSTREDERDIRRETRHKTQHDELVAVQRELTDAIRTLSRNEP